MTAACHIAVITGTRAEYGLLEPVMRAIAAHPALRLSCVAAGTHLTTRSIEDITVPIAARVPMQRADAAGRLADAEALGRGVSGFAAALARLRPQVVMVLGDRIEALAAAAAASVAGFHLAHLHGGDRAQGIADEAMRHAITKLAHLHFPASDQSARRLARLGERPEHIYNHGSPAADGLGDVRPDPDGPGILLMHHPAGDPDAVEQRRMRDTLEAVGDDEVLVMMPNHDPGRAGIVRAIEDAGVEAVEHLPRPVFLTKLKGARAIVGNSSAGLIEAAILGTPSVDVGPRQAGRERPASVIHCDHGRDAVAGALSRALALDPASMSHPYGEGRTGPRIAHTLATLDLQSLPLHKRNTY